LIDASMRDLRALSYALHPPLLDEIGLASAAHWFADGFAKRSGIAAEVEVARDLGRLPPAVEQTLFRILEKCLNNIERHSGSATARVQLLSANGAVTLRVQDAGRGIAPATLRSIERGEATLGIGMLRIRERLHQVGGRLRVDSGDHGTTIEATIPVAPAAGAAPTVSHPGIAASSPPH
jgi:signal transduction histidine kinase